MLKSLPITLLASAPLWGSGAIALPDKALQATPQVDARGTAESAVETFQPGALVQHPISVLVTPTTPESQPAASLEPLLLQRSAAPVGDAYASSNTGANTTSSADVPHVVPTIRNAPEAMGQVTSVDQLSDVQPTDWAYQALRSLVERYGVIGGYSDGTFRGDRVLSRSEFAAALLTALDRIQAIIDQRLGDHAVARDDLATLLRLQTEFSADLALLRGRVRSLESRTTQLETNQFSTTTKLHGEAIFSLAGQLSNGEANRTVFRDRLRLDLVTSFSGSDRLNLRLAAGNASPFRTSSGFDAVEAGTAEGTLISRIGGNTDNEVGLDWLAYSLPIGDRVAAYVSATGGIHSDYVPSTFSPLFEDFDGGNGSLSAFSQQSPIYRIGGGTGAGLTVFLDDQQMLSLTVGYLADEAASPTSNSGLLNGDYAALGQISFTPGDRLQIGVTYVHGYHTDTNSIFDLGDDSEFYVGTSPANAAHIELGSSAITNSYGIQAAYRVNSRFMLHTFGGYTDLAFGTGGSGEIWYYGIGFGFPDLLLPGSFGGLLLGVEPYLGSTNRADLSLENDTSLHLEAFYKLRLSDYLSVTPGIIWISAPNQDASNSDSVIGSFRATFSF